ncbi:MAG: cytochrome c peroxidase [Saprospiraceae bacterium]
MKIHLKKLISISFLAGFLFLVGCQQDKSGYDEELKDLLNESAGGKGLAFFRFPDGKHLSEFPQDPKSPLTGGKIELGRMLFHETGIARKPMVSTNMLTYSCSSCHQSKSGFQAGLAQGISEGGQGFGLRGESRKIAPGMDVSLVDVQPIRTPSALNSGYQEVTLWNGQFGATGMNKGTEASWTAGTPKENNNFGFQGVETQAIAGLDVHRLSIDAAYLNQIPLYPTLFALAFPELPPNERMTRVNGGLAIAAYERTLVANKAPFQKWLAGDNGAMTDQEKKGAILFFGKAACVQCHTGPALNSMNFYGLGMNDLLTGTYGAVNSDASKVEHKGRGGFTGRAEDMFKFKVPQIYNLKDIKFLGHGAQFASVKDVLEYKNNAVPSNAKVPVGQLAAQFKPLGLSDSELEQLRIFIEESLNDPDLARYTPTKLASGLCFPDNDTQSRIDNGCQ